MLATVFLAKGVVARDRAFSPINGMEVLTHGETEITRLPTDASVTCCTVTPINIPIDSTQYYEGPFSELHVTAVGSLQYPSEDGYKQLETAVYTKVNRPASYRKFAFDVGGRFSSVCEDATSVLAQENRKSLAISSTDKARIADLKSGINKRTDLKEAAFTFFSSRKNPEDKAAIRCWPLEEDVLVGALLNNRN